MLADVRRSQELFREHGVPLRYWHNMSDAMPENQWVYADFLAQECRHEVPAVSAWRRGAHSAVGRSIFQQPETFRDLDDRQMHELLTEGRTELSRILSGHAESGCWSYVSSSSQHKHFAEHSSAGIA